MNVLIVDDSSAMRKIITAALGKTYLRGSEGTMGKLESALDEGVDEYVVKPFTPETLDRKIKKVLGVRAQ
jgi:DNA-binding response OmpR family regulator